jgi:hypothetical protein
MHVGSAELGTSHSQEKLHGTASRELDAQSSELFTKMNTTEPFTSVQTSSKQELNILDRRKIRLIEGKAKCHHLKKFTYNRTFRQVFICGREAIVHKAGENISMNDCISSL